MIKFLVDRPIAVFMSFTAFFILGIITYFNIPVSLLPDIAIPEISVQVAAPDRAAREIENTIVAPLRAQLLQVSNINDIRTETRDGAASIKIIFNHGTNTDLAFIEVNEKIDAAMSRIPRGIDRPRVVKASATDIPVFTLNLMLHENDFGPEAFAEMSDFAQAIVRRRIEQLPEVAMVDMSGLMHRQVQVIADKNKLQTSGLTIADIEAVLNSNNVEPGAMVVRDGYYEYNIKFSAVMRTIDDMRRIYIRKNNRLFQLSEFAEIKPAIAKEQGLILYNGRRAIALSVIKQQGENMDKLAVAIEGEIERMRKNYPNIEFAVSQNQTELLDYTISNLKQNMLLAFIFICLVSALFLRDFRSPIVIGICMFVSLVISLLLFYLFNISLNIVSLTGLILAFGNMIDSSIIVTDNIGQHRRNGYSVPEACVRGTNEVILPMLSSMFTTIAVFAPLIFLSGIAGALFFDQAFSVTAGLLVSYITGIMLLPVMYKLVFGLKTPAFIRNWKQKLSKRKKDNESEMAIHERMYHATVHWVMARKMLVSIGVLITFPLLYALFVIIPKEKMPELSQTELMLRLEWNEHINVDENMTRVNAFFAQMDSSLIEHSAQIGSQQFLLNFNHERSSSEAELYMRFANTYEVEAAQKIIEKYFSQNYPRSNFEFAPVSGIFERIFNTAEAPLLAQYYSKNNQYTAEDIAKLKTEIEQLTSLATGTIAFQQQLNIALDYERMLLYGVSYNDIYRTIRTAVKENNFAVLRSNQQYLPIVIATDETDIRSIIDNSMVPMGNAQRGNAQMLNLSSFARLVPAVDIKTIVAGKNGEYVPFAFADVPNPEKTIAQLKQKSMTDDKWDVAFSGSFFSSKTMLREMIVILLVSIMLMYFILAAQFESFVQPLIVLIEIPIDVAAALALLYITGHSLNLMSAIGIVVACGIIINDSILKVDLMNQLRRTGMSIEAAIHEAGHRRLNAIIMTSLTSIVCMLPLFLSNDMGSELEKPLAVAIIGGMLVGTPVSLFIVPMLYWRVNTKLGWKKKKTL